MGQKKKRYKDVLKQTFKRSVIDADSWEEEARNRVGWRFTVFDSAPRQRRDVAIGSSEMCALTQWNDAVLDPEWPLMIIA